MSALSRNVNSHRRRIAADMAAFALATADYAQEVADGESSDAVFASDEMRAALARLDRHVAAARRSARSLPKGTPGRTQVRELWTTLGGAVSAMEQSLGADDMQQGVDAATTAQDKLADARTQRKALGRYLS